MTTSPVRLMIWLVACYAIGWGIGSIGETLGWPIWCIFAISGMLGYLIGPRLLL